MNPQELRELDAWIDRELFDGGNLVGLKKRGLWYRPDAKGYTDRSAEAGRYTREEAKKHEYPHDDPVTICELPIRPYTTDPAAAMLVLEKCGKETVNGTEFVCCSFSTPNSSTLDKNNGHWSVGRISGGLWVSGEIGNATTLPHAICLFAKKLFEK